MVWMIFARFPRATHVTAGPGVSVAHQLTSRHRACAESAARAAEMSSGPFAVGDLVEAVYCQGCWVPSEVIDGRVCGSRRQKQVLVQYEKEETRDGSDMSAAPHYSTRENETVRDVARRFGVRADTILRRNAASYEGLAANARLRRGTLLALPEV